MLRAYLKSIADAIRTKLGITDTINAQEFPNKVNEVYEKGLYDRDLKIWEMFTGNNKRDNYASTFANTDLTDYEFVKPVMVVGSAEKLFYSYYGGNFPKNIDLSNATNAANMFGYARGAGGIYGTEGSAIFYDMKLPALSSYQSTFNNARVIKKIEILRVLENTTFSSTFNGANNLEDITFDGKIGTNISFVNCPLNIKSIKNILLHLKDYSGTTNAGTYTLTLKDTCKTAMAELGAIPELNNKTYTEYLASIGWVLG